MILRRQLKAGRLPAAIAAIVPALSIILHEFTLTAEANKKRTNFDSLSWKNIGIYCQQAYT
jgi:hypothetical protein